MKSVVILVSAVLALSACHHQRAAPATPRGIVVSQARLVLPAVKGNPGAAYFTVRNRNTAPATLLHIDVAGAASAQMHETSGGTMHALPRLRIDAGQQVVFAPAGKHVMVFGLQPSLAAGDTGRIVLHFQDGTMTSAPLAVAAAGGAMAGMSEMPGMTMDGKP